MRSPTTAKTVTLIDLDNTLINSNKFVFPELESRIAHYLMKNGIPAERAREAVVQFPLHYGLTVLGVEVEFGLQVDQFLTHTHAELCDRIPRDKRCNLLAMIRRIPGEKWIVSDGPRCYVTAVIKRLKLQGVFSRCYYFESFRTCKSSSKYFRLLGINSGICSRKMSFLDDRKSCIVSARRCGIKARKVKQFGKLRLR